MFLSLVYCLVLYCVPILDCTSINIGTRICQIWDTTSPNIGTRMCINIGTRLCINFGTEEIKLVPVRGHKFIQRDHGDFYGLVFLSCWVTENVFALVQFPYAFMIGVLASDLT